MAFDGQLSINDIFNMTEKELGILWKHRRERSKGYSEQKQVKQLVGALGGAPVS